MKRLIVLIAFSAFCAFSVAQEIKVKNVVKLSLPQGFEKVPVGKSSNSISSSKRSELNLEEKNVEFYKIGDITIQLNAGPGKVSSNHLEELKKGLDEMYSIDGSPFPPKYNSSIKTINGVKALVVTYAREYSSYYRVFSINKTHTIAFTAVIEFKEADRLKATNILDQMLKTLKYEG